MRFGSANRFQSNERFPIAQSGLGKNTKPFRFVEDPGGIGFRLRLKIVPVAITTSTATIVITSYSVILAGVTITEELLFELVEDELESEEETDKVVPVCELVALVL